MRYQIFHDDPPQVSLSLLPGFGVVKFTKQFLVARFVLRNRPGNPGVIQIMLQGNILVGDIAGPDYHIPCWKSSACHW